MKINQKTKDIGEIVIYAFAIIGLLDMFMYFISEGDIRLIRMFLSLFFEVNE